MDIIAFQSDPFEQMDPATETTLSLIKKAIVKGYSVFNYTPQDLYLYNQTPYAKGRFISYNAKGELTIDTKSVTIDLNTVRVIFIRQDPPFDMNYITTTYLLDLVKPQTLVLNKPESVRNYTEKLSLSYFPEFTVPSVVTNQKSVIMDFLNEHKAVILKPLYAFGGSGIFKLTLNDTNLHSILDSQLESGDYKMCQRFIPESIEGDKRLIMVNGQLVGAFRRKPQTLDFRSNISAGGVALKAEITPRDSLIANHVGAFLQEKGLFLVGIDIIGDFITEINVTSPAYYFAEALDGIDISEIVIDAMSRLLNESA